MNNLPNNNTKKFVKIGEASVKLGVSIDTLRRWEKAGKIETIRTLGGTRLYPISTLKALTENPKKYKAKRKVIPEKSQSITKPAKKFVKIGEAAEKLGFSIDTLRRWEKSGKIETTRTPGGTRLYAVSTLKDVIANPQKNKTSLPGSHLGGTNEPKLSTVEDLMNHLDETSDSVTTPQTDQKWQEFMDGRKLEPEVVTVFSEAEVPASVVSRQSSDNSG